MNFHTPSDEEIHTAFEHGERAIRALFHDGATQRAELAQQLAQQGEVLHALQAHLAQPSRNSSQPPARDGYGTMKRTASLREPGQKPTGGQPGHDGHPLMAAVSPDQTLTHAVSTCAYCQAAWQAVEPMGYEERQVFDLPALRIAVTAHRAEIKGCPACGKLSTGLFPAAVTQAVPYGPTVQAWAAYFTNHHHIPVERPPEIFADLVPHQLSDAPVWKASEHLDACIVPATEAVKGLLRGAQGLHTDESGLRVRGTWHWLQVASTKRLTSYEVHAKRGHEAMEAAGILDAFRGTGVHAHWKPYVTYDACAHALCHAHHLRELRYVATQEHQGGANDMAARLVEITAAGAATPAPAMGVALPELLAFETRYDALVQAGFAANPRAVAPTKGAPTKRGRPQQSPPVNLLMRLRDFKKQGWAFMADFRVPFDNNQGERDIRRVQVKQKVSGGGRTLEGAQQFGRIRGYLSPARQQAKNVCEALRDALEGRPFIPSPDMQ